MFNRSIAIICILFVSLFVLLGQADFAVAGDLLFYEGNNCSGDIIAEYDSHNGNVEDNCKKTRRCDNDEARSLELLPGVPEYSFIVVADNPDGKTNDDYAEIKVFMSPKSKTCIGTFEANNSYNNIIITYYRDNGLDGKVSYISIDPGN